MAFNTLYRDKDLEKMGVEAKSNTSDNKTSDNKTSDKLVAERVKRTNSPKQLKEYSELAAELGLEVPSILVETFKEFLVKNDIPVFKLAEVVKYMDKKAAEESKDKCGWEWRPLRRQDHRVGVSIGIMASSAYDFNNKLHVVAASDFYTSPSIQQLVGGGGGGGGGIAGGSGGNGSMMSMQLAQMQMQAAQQAGMGNTVVVNYPVDSPNRVYDMPIPMHALKKVDLITKAFGHKVGLFVSDYALAPAIEYPDPFLMAMIDNPFIKRGEGRFIIDFWSEPGFGLSQQLA